MGFGMFSTGPQVGLWANGYERVHGQHEAFGPHMVKSPDHEDSPDHNQEIAGARCCDGLGVHLSCELPLAVSH